MPADSPLSPTVTQDRTERVLGHSPLRQAPPQSSFDPTAALAFRRWQLPTRVSALFATSLQCVHLLRGFPSPRYVPSAGVLSLSTVYSALQLVSLFHPTAALRALLVQGFGRSAQPPSLIGRSCPLAAGPRPAYRRVGCHGSRSSTSRLCSMQSRESQDWRLDRTNDRSPLRVLCSFRSPPCRCPRLPGAHAHGVFRPRLPSRERDGWLKRRASSALTTGSSATSSPRLPTCSSFRAFPKLAL
jgi:hypothetical protein